MATTIITKNGSGAPVAGNLTEGELALDLTNKKLYSKQGSTVFEVGATGGGASGTFTDLTATSSFTSPGIDDNANATAITIDSGENVGVGETSPAARIHSKTSAQTLALLETTNSTRGVLFLKDANTTGNTHVGIGAVGDDLQLFSGGSTARVILNNSGKVGIGTSPAENLHVASSGGSTLRLENSTASLAQYAELGAIEFYTNDGSNAGVGTAASIRSLVIGSTGGQGSLAFSVASDTTNDEEVMRINSTGVGIGEILPLAPLHVKATEGSTGETDPIARFERFTSGDNAYLDITVNNSTNMIGFQSTGSQNGGFTFGGATTDLVTIDSVGNVGIGTTPPTQRQLYVQEPGTGYGGAITAATATAAGNAGYRYDTAGVTRWSTTLVGTAGSEDLRFMKDGSSEKYRLGATGKMALVGLSGGLQLRTGTTSQDAFVDWQFGSTTTNYIRMGIDYDTRASTGWMVDSGYPITLDYTTNLAFKASGADKMLLDVSGNLLVGKTSAGYTIAGIELNGASDQFIIKSNSTPMTINRNTAGPSATITAFYLEDTLAGIIAVTKGSAPVFAASSDERLKDNIVDHESELANVMALRPTRWDWKDGAMGSGEGFIAQELEATAWSDLVSEGDDGFKQVSGLGTVETRLIKAIQEQQVMIETLQAEVAALKGAN